MKKINLIFGLVVVILMNYSCTPKEPPVPGFKDMIHFTIYDFVKDSSIVDDPTHNYSSFLEILQKGGIDKTLSAYNPNGDNYTLFLPSNDAIDRFIQNDSRFSSLQDLLNNQAFVDVFSRYYVLNKGYRTDNFPFGAFAEPTLSDDYLTVSFIVQPDTSYYKINNQAPVMRANIEASNGFIHLISECLVPVTFTTYEWLGLHDEYSIFKSAVDMTGFKDSLSTNLKEVKLGQPLTLLVEPDSIYNKNKIYSADDLAQRFSPGRTDYTNPTNPLFNFVGYHILVGNYYLDDMEGLSTNYATLSDIPLNINGAGLDIAINKGKQVFDTIVHNQIDTTFIDYIGFYYDQSNVLTQSGAIHFINQLMTQQKPNRAIKNFQFHEEPLLNEYRTKAGSYLIEDTLALQRIRWSGADLSFVQEAAGSETTLDGDYLQIQGDFVMTYRIPKIVQGKYTAFLAANAYSSSNAVVEVFIDGKKIGGLVDLSRGGSANNPFPKIELGTIDFIKYSEHTIKISSLIPGRFLWDYIQFEPYN